MTNGDSFTAFPIRIEQRMRMTGMVVRQSTPGLTDLIGAVGVVDSTEEPVVMVAMELPEARSAGRSKSEQEIEDVAAFVRDHLSVPNLERISPGSHRNEPPDCLVSIRGREFAVETAQLMLPSKAKYPNAVGRWKLFEQLREHLFRDCGRLQPRLRQHRGSMVSVWFNLDGENRLPPRGNEIEHMIDHLKSVSPPSGEVLRRLHRASDTIPANTVINQNAAGSVGCTWAALPVDYRSSLRATLGFDIGLAYHDSFTRSDLRAELKRVVQQHDDTRSDVLVLSVGGLTREGTFFPSSGMFANALFDDPNPLNGWAPRHVPAVVLHDQLEDRSRWLHGREPWMGR
mgnify:FL=1